MNEIIRAYRVYKDTKKENARCRAINDSNMNLVLQIEAGGRSWLLKHADPWIRKYPDIAAPACRTKHEAHFYQYLVCDTDIQEYMPHLLGYNSQENVLVLEFLESAHSGMGLYKKDIAGISQNTSVQVLQYLGKLHTKKPIACIDWTNKALRALNHAHIFSIPLEENHNLDKFCHGLQKASQAFRQDSNIKKRFEELGSLYLADSSYSLLHGDLYPGSLLLQGKKVFVIDPEFCFVGPAEFDVGVYLAHHLILGGPVKDLALLSNIYQEEANHSLDLNLLRGFCGSEIIRRLLGVARLPISWSLSRYQTMLDLGKQLCLQN